MLVCKQNIGMFVATGLTIRDNDVKTTPSVILVFVTVGAHVKNRRGNYQFPISEMYRDISVSVINTDISN